MGEPICERMCHNWLFYMNSAHPVYIPLQVRVLAPAERKGLSQDRPFLFSLTQSKKTEKPSLVPKSRNRSSREPSRAIVKALILCEIHRNGALSLTIFCKFLQTTVCTPPPAHILKLLQERSRRIITTRIIKGKMEYKDHILNEVIRQIFLESRRKRGLTQNSLSCLSNITRQFISQVEGGKKIPSITTLSALANAYNKSLSDLFNEVDRLYPLVENRKPFFEISTNFAAEARHKMTEYISNAKRKKTGNSLSHNQHKAPRSH